MNEGPQCIWPALWSVCNTAHVRNCPPCITDQTRLPCRISIIKSTAASQVQGQPKRDLQVVGTISGTFLCRRHPLKACLDPCSGDVLAVGTEAGSVHVYSLRQAISQTVATTKHILPLSIMQHAAPNAAHAEPGTRNGSSDAADATARHAPVHCVAWNPCLHMMAVTGRYPGARTALLCHGRAERGPQGTAR